MSKIRILIVPFLIISLIIAYVIIFLAFALSPQDSRINDLDKRITVLETQLEERWKETILRIKRIEQILFGSAGTIIVLLVGIILKVS